MPTRAWDIELDGGRHHVEIDYKVITGFMSILVDGQRRARGWREWQTVWGGAKLGCPLGTHRLDALVTQRYGTQGYRFRLEVDGVPLPGSDAEPSSSTVKAGTVASLALLADTVMASTFASQGLWLLAVPTLGAGVLAALVIGRATWSRGRRALIGSILTIGWPVILITGGIVVHALNG